MKTKITELLQIEYPIFQGGMAWVAEHKLAAAVSNAGGLGIIGAASAPPEVVREEIRKCKELTDKPFGVNIMLLNPNAEDVAKIVVEEGVKAVTTGAGNPGKFMELWKNAGVKVIPVVASVAMAKMMERAGADAVVAQAGKAAPRRPHRSGGIRCRAYDWGLRDDLVDGILITTKDTTTAWTRSGRQEACGPGALPVYQRDIYWENYGEEQQPGAE